MSIRRVVWILRRVIRRVDMGMIRIWGLVLYFLPAPGGCSWMGKFFILMKLSAQGPEHREVLLITLSNISVSPACKILLISSRDDSEWVFKGLKIRSLSKHSTPQAQLRIPCGNRIDLGTLICREQDAQAVIIVNEHKIPFISTPSHF